MSLRQTLVCDWCGETLTDVGRQYAHTRRFKRTGLALHSSFAELVLDVYMVLSWTDHDAPTGESPDLCEDCARKVVRRLVESWGPPT